MRAGLALSLSVFPDCECIALVSNTIPETGPERDRVGYFADALLLYILKYMMFDSVIYDVKHVYNLYIYL